MFCSGICEKEKVLASSVRRKLNSTMRSKRYEVLWYWGGRKSWLDGSIIRWRDQAALGKERISELKRRGEWLSNKAERNRYRGKEERNKSLEILQKRLLKKKLLIN